MTAYVIEKNVPLTQRKEPEFYPWAEMSVGDSFLVPCSEDEIDATRARMSGVCSGRRQKHGQKFATRSVEGGIRIWRTA